MYITLVMNITAVSSKFAHTCLDLGNNIAYYLDLCMVPDLVVLIVLGMNWFMTYNPRVNRQTRSVSLDCTRDIVID